MDDTFEKASEAARFIKNHFKDDLRFAVITGSGMSQVLNDYVIKGSLSFEEVPHLNQTTFHKGSFLHLQKDNISFLGLTGRLHYYEGFSSKEITFPIRVLSRLGITKVLMTNASGGLNAEYKPGEIILVKDHINLLPDHPLRGPNDDRFGARFPDMSNAYDLNFRKTIKEAAQISEINLKEGVYVCFQGPSLETKAEYKFLNVIGADLTGMSTVPEVIVCNHCGIEVAVLSIVTNVCFPPEAITETTLEEVIEIAAKAVEPLKRILTHLLPHLN